MAYQLLDIPVAKLRPNPQQVRKTFDREKISELAASLSSTGQVIPIMVTESDGGFMLVSGERRLRAAKEAGLKTIQAVVVEVPKQELRLRALIENLAREDLLDAEKEEAIAKEWASGRWKSMPVLSKALGHAENYVGDIIRGIRVKHGVRGAESLPSDYARRLAPLLAKEGGKETASAIATALKAGAIPRETNAIDTAVKIVPKLAPLVRKALVAGEISLDRAEDLAAFKTPAQQVHVLREITGGLNAVKRGVEYRKAQVEGRAAPDFRVKDEEAAAVAIYEELYLKVLRVNPATLREAWNEVFSTKGKQVVKNYLKQVKNHVAKLEEAIGG